MCNPRRSDTKSPKKVARNLGQEIPLDKKIKYITRNMWIRVSRLQTCCGHPGQPGC